MKLNKIKPKFILKANPRIGLIVLGSDFRIEKAFRDCGSWFAVSFLF